jgi:saccharopine dehydrogenase-like NADP-dependent oxidoreductase
MVEYTIRDVNHWKIIDALIHTGLINNATIQDELTKAWIKPALGHGRTDMEVVCAGTNGRSVIWQIQDFDTPHASSMARTTGFTACAIAQYISSHQVGTAHYVVGPESLVAIHSGIWEFVVTYLGCHGVNVVELVV